MADMSAENKGYRPEPLRVSSNFMRIATPLLVGSMALAACSPEEVQAYVDQANDARPVATDVFIPTPTETQVAVVEPSATLTETPEPENRVFPVQPEYLFNRDSHLRNLSYDNGGYFLGIPDLEQPHSFLFADFSYEGEIRIVEAGALDPSSWGIYAEKANQEYRIPPGYGISSSIQDVVFLGEEIRDIEIVWGDLAPGTGLWISHELLDDLVRIHEVPQDFVLEKMLPVNDDRFVCEEVTSLSFPNGETEEISGILCKAK